MGRRSAGASECQPMETCPHLQYHHRCPLGYPGVVYPPADQQSIGDGIFGRRFPDHLSLQDPLHEGRWQPPLQELTKGQGADEIRRGRRKIHDLVGDESPKNGQSPGRHGDLAILQQVGQCPLREVIELDFVVAVGFTHQGGGPPFAGQAVGTELSALFVKGIQISESGRFVGKCS